MVVTEAERHVLQSVSNPAQCVSTWGVEKRRLASEMRRKVSTSTVFQNHYVMLAGCDS